MKFSDLEACPFCGYDEFYVKQRVTGYSTFFERYDGEEADDNSQMYDSLIFHGGEKAYCVNCDRYIGNKEKNVIGKNAEKKIKQNK